MNKISKFFLVSIAFLPVSCSDFGKISHEELVFEQTLTNLYMFEAQSGETKWILQAKKAHVLQDNSQAELIAPVICFKERDKTLSELESKKGFLDLNTKNMTFSGNVEVRSYQENIHLTTEKLNYSFEDDAFFTDGYVKIKKHSAIVEGKGFRAYSDLSEIVILSQKTKLPKK
jgi:LPS export ABC transporter protein LptC